MEIGEFFEGSALTGRQAAIIGFTFLTLIILAALLLIMFGDVLQDLFTMVDPQVWR